MIKKNLSRLEKLVIGLSLVVIGLLGLVLNIVYPLVLNYSVNLDTYIIVSINLLWILIGVLILR